MKSGANLGRFPGKIFEYMAVGRPVVATDIEDVTTIISQGQIGLVAEDNPQALVCKLQRLVDDPVLRQEMGKRARRLAETEYRWEKRGKQLEALYQEILLSKDYLDV